MKIERRMSLTAAAVFTAAMLASGAPASAQTPDPTVYYRLTTDFRGPDRALDVFNGGPKNNLIHLDRRQNVSGQF